jgi:hypothetical protein
MTKFCLGFSALCAAMAIFCLGMGDWIFAAIYACNSAVTYISANELANDGETS